uniref:Metalloendopeptidase n=1 Tax=Elaeophora elaphi TaxID=1147741 RepID=A0A0R3S6K4_9BILA
MRGVIQMQKQLIQLSDGEDDDHGEQNYDSKEDDDSKGSMYREDLFEGDIVLISNDATVHDRSKSINEQAVECAGQNNCSASRIEMNTIQLRSAVRQKTLLWQKGQIPYVISSAYDNISKLIILDAFDEYQLLTCIRFVPKRQFDFNYIYIAPYSGCYSMVGNNGGKQIVSLGDGCLKKGIVIHELMHVIGFFHEQNRADRDSYVDIVWENVKPSLVEQFDKYSSTIIDDLGSPYDYDSVTHYSPMAFSKNGKPTIIPKHIDEVMRLGQRRGLSTIDIWKINKLYNCDQQTTTISYSNVKNEKEFKEAKFPTTQTNATVPSISSTTFDTMTIIKTTTRTNDFHEFKISLNLSKIPIIPTQLIPTSENDSINLSPAAKINVIIAPAAAATADIPTTSTNITPQRMRHCADHHPYCQKLKTRNFCIIYPRFVQDYCAFSCGKC